MTQLLLTEEQAAQALQVCGRTLRKARQQGALPYVRIGRTIRYTENDLTQFIERARECPSIVERTPRSGITRSRLTVFDFEEARAEKASVKRKP